VLCAVAALTVAVCVLLGDSSTDIIFIISLVRTSLLNVAQFLSKVL
jgi:hypothetical protein